MPQFGRRLKAPTFRADVSLSCSGDPRLVPWVARFFMRMKFWRGTSFTLFAPGVIVCGKSCNPVQARADAPRISRATVKVFVAALNV